MSILKTIYLQHLNGANANMTLDSNGYVGVGTTSPNRPLEVAGAWRLGTDSGAYAGGLGGGFNVSNNIYSMYFRDRTDTSWNDVFFETKSLRLKVNNGADTGIYIDSSARVTKPYQPYLRAFSTGFSNQNLTGGTTYVIPFNSIDSQVGSNYNNSTYRFTCPVAGAYYVLASIQGNGITSNYYNYYIRVNGSGRIGTYQTGRNVGYEKIESSGVVLCNAGDYIDTGFFVNQTNGYIELPPGDTRNQLIIYLLG